RPTVVLPQPLSPTIPSVSPRWIANETPSTARTSATLPLKIRPCETGKCFLRSSTSTSGFRSLIAGLQFLHPPNKLWRDFFQVVSEPDFPACIFRSQIHNAAQTGSRATPPISSAATREWTLTAGHAGGQRAVKPPAMPVYKGGLANHISLQRSPPPRYTRHTSR